MAVIQTAPARWPYAEFNSEQTTYPCIVVEWQKMTDANGYATWCAKCVYWDNGAKVAMIPHMRVRRVGG